MQKAFQQNIFQGSGVFSSRGHGNYVISESEQVAEVRQRLGDMLRIINEGEQVSEPISAFQSTIFQSNAFQTIAKRGVLRGLGAVKILNETQHIVGDREKTFQSNIFQNNIFSAADVVTTIKVRGLLKHTADSLNISESLYKGWGKIVNEAVNIIHFTGRPLDIVKYINETLNISTAPSKLITVVKWVSDTVNIKEPFSTFTNEIFQNNVFQMVTLKGIVRKMTIARMINETERIIHFDGNTRTMWRTVSETLQLSEIKQAYRDRSKFINETLQLSELVPRLRARFRYVNEVVQSSESLYKGFVKYINEAINLEEPLSPLQATLFQNNVFQVVTKKGIVRAMGFVMILPSEAMQIAEIVPRLGLRIRFENAVMNLSELAQSYRDRYRFINENEHIIHFDGRNQIIRKYINETVQVSATLFRGLGKLIDENLQLAEVRYSAWTKRVNEVVQSSESLYKGFGKIVSDGTVQLAETLLKPRVMFRVRDEIIQISEITPKVMNIIRHFNMTVNLSEVKQSYRDRFRRINENVHIIHFDGRLSVILRAINETINIGDAYKKVKNRTVFVGRSARLYNRIKGVKLFKRGQSTKGASR